MPVDGVADYDDDVAVDGRKHSLPPSSGSDQLSRGLSSYINNNKFRGGETK